MTTQPTKEERFIEEPQLTLRSVIARLEIVFRVDDGSDLYVRITDGNCADAMAMYLSETQARAVRNFLNENLP